MPNPWITHVKRVQREKNLTYKEALEVASKSYHHKPRKMKGRGVSDDAKKLYTKHKKKIHAVGGAVGGALLSGLTAYQLAKYRKNHGLLARFVREGFDPNFAYV